MAGLAQESDPVFPAIVSTEIVFLYASRQFRKENPRCAIVKFGWMMICPALPNPCLAISPKPTTPLPSKIDGQNIG